MKKYGELCSAAEISVRSHIRPYGGIWRDIEAGRGPERGPATDVGLGGFMGCSEPASGMRPAGSALATRTRHVHPTGHFSKFL